VVRSKKSLEGIESFGKGKIDDSKGKRRKFPRKLAL